MVHFVIAGTQECKNFGHALYVADYLQKNLPNFTYGRIDVVSEDWRYWLDKINRKYGWHVFNSPVIYKHLIGFGQTAHLIGSLSEFWEYCYDYYGLESLLTKEELENLLKDNLDLFSKESTDKPERTNILVYGYDDTLELLVPQLLQLESIQGTVGVSFTFYSEEPNIFKPIVEFLLSDENVHAVATDNINAAVKDCHLLLIVCNFDLNPRRIIIEMKYLSETLNALAKRYIKIVFACNGLSCFAATVLLGNSEVIRNNLVVVTSDLGLPSLHLVTQSCHLTLEDFCGPPVWGFIGKNEFVDIGNCLKKCNLVKPYQRAIKSTDGTTLLQGTMATEFRYIKYMSDDIPNFNKTLQDNKEIITNSLKRLPTYAKINATMNLIDLWFSKKHSDEVISAGVVSDGSFGIPAGIVFSQPSSLVDKIWQPFPDYPVTDAVMDTLADLIESTKDFLRSCDKYFTYGQKKPGASF